MNEAVLFRTITAIEKMVEAPSTDSEAAMLKMMSSLKVIRDSSQDGVETEVAFEEKTNETSSLNGLIEKKKKKRRRRSKQPWRILLERCKSQKKEDGLATPPLSPASQPEVLEERDFTRKVRRTRIWRRKNKKEKVGDECDEVISPSTTQEEDSPLRVQVIVSGKDEKQQALEQSNKELDQPTKELDEPRRELDQPRKELDQPSKELDQPSKELDQPSKELDQPSKELEQPSGGASEEKAEETSLVSQKKSKKAKFLKYVGNVLNCGTEEDADTEPPQIIPSNPEIQARTTSDSSRTATSKSAVIVSHLPKEEGGEVTGEEVVGHDAHHERVELVLVPELPSEHDAEDDNVDDTDKQSSEEKDDEQNEMDVPAPFSPQRQTSSNNLFSTKSKSVSKLKEWNKNVSKSFTSLFSKTSVRKIPLQKLDDELKSSSEPLSPQQQQEDSNESMEQNIDEDISPPRQELHKSPSNTLSTSKSLSEQDPITQSRSRSFASHQNITTPSNPPNTSKDTWKAVLDKQTGNIYYYNPVTLLTTWEKPPAPIEPHDELEAFFIQQKESQNFDPDIWAKRMEVYKLLMRLSPDEPEANDKIMDMYTGREDVLLTQLEELMEQTPFDEPGIDPVRSLSNDEEMDVKPKRLLPPPSPARSPPESTAPSSPAVTARSRSDTLNKSHYGNDDGCFSESDASPTRLLQCKTLTSSSLGGSSLGIKSSTTQKISNISNMAVVDVNQTQISAESSTFFASINQENKYIKSPSFSEEDKSNITASSVTASHADAVIPSIDPLQEIFAEDHPHDESRIITQRSQDSRDETDDESNSQPTRLRDLKAEEFSGSKYALTSEEFSKASKTSSKKKKERGGAAEDLSDLSMMANTDDELGSFLTRSMITTDEEDNTTLEQSQVTGSRSRKSKGKGSVGSNPVLQNVNVINTQPSNTQPQPPQRPPTPASTLIMPSHLSAEEWTQTELDLFISQNDWDSVIEYIAKMKTNENTPPAPSSTSPYEQHAKTTSTTEIQPPPTKTLGAARSKPQPSTQETT